MADPAVIDVLRPISAGAEVLVIRDPALVQLLGSLGVEQRIVELAGAETVGYNSADIQAVLDRIGDGTRRVSF
jgi:hypothetical protein